MSTGPHTLRPDFEIAGRRISPGQRLSLDVPIVRLYTHAPLPIPVEVIHGRRPGPVLLVCGALHGDEINGVEIVRRLLHSSRLDGLSGTLVAVPIVNVLGFVQHSRYLPDRRDLNRCFPGREDGSLGARVAALFRREVVDRASHIIDLHTGALHRSNLPQVRLQLGVDDASRQMADAFGAPVILNAPLREGSLRAYAQGKGIPVLTFEAGEALRFDEWAISAGVRGILRVMRKLKMIPAGRSGRPGACEVALGASWVRAPQDGILRPRIRLGARVSPGQILGLVASPIGDVQAEVPAPGDGIVIGINNLPLVNRGEALFNIARFKELDDAESAVEEYQEALELGLR